MFLHMRARLLIILIVLGVFATEPFGGGSAPQAQTSANPLRGLTFYVDRESPSWLQWQAYRRAGQARKAELIEKIAREPKALWLGRFTRPNFFVKVRRLIDPAQAEGSVPIFTVLRARGHRMLARVHGRRPGRGRADARLVRRPGRARSGATAW